MIESLTSSALYYFFSTTSQAYAALLAILLTVYVYLENIYASEGEKISDANERIISGHDENVYLGTLTEAIAYGDNFVLSGDPLRPDRKKDVVKENLVRLKKCILRLKSAREIPKITPLLLFMVAGFAIATPFGDYFQKSKSGLILVAMGCLLIVISTLKLGGVLKQLSSAGGDI